MMPEFRYEPPDRSSKSFDRSRKVSVNAPGRRGQGLEQGVRYAVYLWEQQTDIPEGTELTPLTVTHTGTLLKGCSFVPLRRSRGSAEPKEVAYSARLKFGRQFTGGDPV